MRVFAFTIPFPRPLLECIREVARMEGLFICPEGAAAVAAFKRLAAGGYLHPEQRVVLFNTGSGLNTPNW